MTAAKTGATPPSRVEPPPRAGARPTGPDGRGVMALTEQLTALVGQRVLPLGAVTNHGKERAMKRRRVFRLIAILFTVWTLLDASAAEARKTRPPGSPRPSQHRRCHPGTVCRHGTGFCNDAGRCCNTADGDVACGSSCCEFATQACCGGSTCVDVLQDNDNCGGCGIVCSGGKSCQNRVCTCPAGTTDCGDTCVDTQSDDNNCGACGNACSAGESCSLGRCGCSDPSQLSCDGQCIDVSGDRNNCGACGNVCSAGRDCVGGQCQLPCDACHERVNNVCVLKDIDKDTVCDGACVDTRTDSDNCGTCGKVCVGGDTCQNGVCTGGGCPEQWFSCGVSYPPHVERVCCRNGSTCSIGERGASCCSEGTFACPNLDGYCCPAGYQCCGNHLGYPCVPPGAQCPE